MKSNAQISTKVVLIGLISLSIFGLMSKISSAQSTYNPSSNPDAQYALLEPLPCIDGTDCKVGEVKETINFETYVQYAFNLFIALAAVAAVLMIVWGGFKYTTTDSFYGKNEGKTIIWNAVQGLLLVLCSFLILRTIDPRLVNIPTTIVKPLDYNIKKGGITGFLNQLGSGMNFGSYRSEAQANLSKAETAVGTLTTRKTELTRQYETALKTANEEEINRLQVEIENIDNQIRDINTEAVMQSSWLGTLGILDSSAALISVPGANTASAVRDKMQTVNDAYAAAVNHLKYVSNPPDPKKLQELEDEKNFALGMLTMQKDAIEAGESLRAKWAGAWGSMKGVFSGASTINPAKIRSLGNKSYNGYVSGYKAGADASFVNRVGTNVIKGYAEKISNPALKDELTNAANQIIAPQP